jgi:hypothetical protein
VSQTPSYSERVRKAFEPDARGVVGVVDELLALGNLSLQLDWKDGVCHVGSVQVPLPKSVFRAVLARLAVLCNEYKAESVSPYGGTGEIAVGTDPPEVFRVSFTNTPAEQSATIQRASESSVLPSTPDAPVQKAS